MKKASSPSVPLLRPAEERVLFLIQSENPRPIGWGIGLGEGYLLRLSPATWPTEIVLERKCAS